MAFEFKLPDVGEGVTEGEIVAWNVKAGDPIAEDEAMVEIMTDKATVVIPSPVSGVVLECRGEVGDIIPVHDVLVVIDTDGSGADAPAPAAEEPPPEEEAPPPAAAAAPPEPSKAPAAPAPTPGIGNGSAQTARVLAAPATRRVAREMGLDLATVVGTGRDGRITREDVLRAGTAAGISPQPEPVKAVIPARPITEILPGLPPASGPAVVSMPPRSAEPAREAPATAPATSRPEGDLRIPIRGMRRRIAERMVASRHNAAHFTFVEECDVTRLGEMRKRVNAAGGDDGQRISFLPFIIKACVAAMRKHPTINSRVDEERQEIVQSAAVHVGLAAATDRGLMVPVVHDADQLPLREIAAAVDRLGKAAREGTAKVEDLTGSTFTITSLGKQGGLFATPILNHPEVAILGVHQIKRRPVVADDDSIVIRDIMLLSLSFDHRIIDGHVGAAFCYEVIRYLEDPELLLLELV